MKKKNESVIINSTQKNAHKKGENGSNQNAGARTSVTDKVKARAGRGMSNEGTNVSYEEER